MLDYGVAATSAAIPALLGFDKQDSAEATYFHAQGAGETVIAGISDYSDDSGAKKMHRQYRRERLRAA